MNLYGHFNLYAFGVLIVFQLFAVRFPSVCNGQSSRIGLGLVSTDPNDVKFYLYNNKSNIEQHVEIVHDDVSSLNASGYDRTKPLILLVHGMLSNYQTPSDVRLVKTAFLETKKQANLVMVDYGALTLSNLPLIYSSLSILHGIGGHLNTIIVGTRIADFIQFLKNSQALPSKRNNGPSSAASSVRIIGFSLGAHISGVAGNLIAERTGKKIARITALDPSPHFPIPGWALIAENAKFVDVSYTSLGLLAPRIVEDHRRRGHVEFYINGGGPHQPNCPNIFPVAEPLCSHATAAYYYAKSIKIKDIKSCQCGEDCSRETWLLNQRTGLAKEKKKSCQDAAVYGEYTSKRARGNYYVDLA